MEISTDSMTRRSLRVAGMVPGDSFGGGEDLSASSRDDVLDVRVDAVDRATAVELIIKRARRGDKGAYVCLTNVHAVVEAQRDSALREACDSAFLSVPDGMPLVWILRHRGRRPVEKVTGIEHMPLVAQAGRSVDLRHFFFGGAPGVAKAAARGLEARVPGTQVVGAYSPPFGDPETWDLGELQAELADKKPHIMWVGLGAPKQERWMASVAGTLDVPMMVGVGAAFDFLAGTKRAAPRVMSDIGLEWLFRFASEPKRLWQRYLVGNSRFLWMLVRNGSRESSEEQRTPLRENGKEE
jgi:N-acetylglucosaminyldiphosphoundecaprenol N-acetyl-beta-D-mannosaminyltransferase